MANIIRELRSIRRRDPAARHGLEVALTYPGFHALLFYRLAHGLWRIRLKLLARIIAAISRVLTGIEIHPAAVIGAECLIDHGAGVVIGETAVIGDRCTLYQGVTLGGMTLERGKRHPTLGNDVVVGAGAVLLGPIRVGDRARIGANAVVLNDVAADAVMVGIPAREKPTHGAPDNAPLLARVAALEARLAEFEQVVNAATGGAAPMPRFDA